VYKTSQNPERTDNLGKLSCKLEEPQISRVAIYDIIRLKLRDANAETSD